MVNKLTNKQKLCIVLISILLLICGGIGTYWYLNRQYYTTIKYYTGKAEIESYKMINDGKAIIIHWESKSLEEDSKIRTFGGRINSDRINRVGRDYVLLENIKLPSSPYFMSEKPKSDEYWTLSAYRVQDGQLQKEKEINLYEVVANYNANYIPIDMGNLYMWEGEEYLDVFICKLNNRNTKEKVFLNVKTRQIRKISELESISAMKFPKIGNRNLYLSSQGINRYLVEGTEFSVDPKAINHSKFKDDAAITDLLGQKNTYVYPLNSENDIYKYEKSRELYALFLPKNFNVYEGTWIPTELSTDGQEHTVNSKEEYEKYYDIEKAKELYHFDE